ncbi:MAG: class I SAM-dependent methyltransferase [Elusimicrobia bacterium]|nr:class I SAM-dependent methyltransferase [Elusimicrobiota bacterium]
MTAPRCLACGSSNSSKEFDSMEPGFSIRSCSNCDLGFTWPPVPEAEIGSWYPETYYGKENVRFNAIFERMTHLFQRRRAKVLRARTSPGPVLDVGCGRGFLLGYLRGLGYEPHGIELSETAAWHAKRRLGLAVEIGDFLGSAHPDGRFKAVVFWHTLEHFPRPAAALAKAARLLEPGGLLAVAVPNRESLQARLFGKNWFHLDVPRHYTHFASRSLEALLSRHGLRIVKLDHFCFEQNPYGWLQSFYNLLGFDFNFLYALLKNRSARTIRIRRHPFQALGTLALLPLLLPLSLFMTVAEAALRRGGTIEVYAVKR